jgi:hypothetical protein
MDSVPEQSAGRLSLAGSHMGYIMSERSQPSLIVGCSSSLSTIQRVFDYTASGPQVPERAEGCCLLQRKVKPGWRNLNFTKLEVADYS